MKIDRPVRFLSCGGGSSAAIEASGDLLQWGQTSALAAPRIVPLSSPVLQIACGVMHSVCLLASGTVLFWAAGTSPRTVSAPELQDRIVLFLASDALTCYFVVSRTLEPTVQELISWAPDTEKAELISILDEPAHQIVAGGDTVLVVSTTGSVLSRTLASKVTADAKSPLTLLSFPDGARIRRAACGGQHCLAVSETGQLFAWGRNNCGQLGNGTRTDSIDVPLLVPLEEPVVHCAAGGGLGCAHSIAVASDHLAVFVFGSNKFGQLGTGRSLGDELVPVRVSMPGVQSASCGWLHSLFVVENRSEIVQQGRVNMLGLFAMLPKDVLFFLLRKLSPVALSRLSCCNMTMNELCSDDMLWKALFLARGGSLMCSRTWKLSYIQRFGPGDRPIAVSRWGISAFRPIQVLMSIISPGKKECRLLMVGLDAAGKKKKKN